MTRWMLKQRTEQTPRPWRRQARRASCPLLAVLALVGCGEAVEDRSLEGALEAESRVAFREEAIDRGLEFHHRSGQSGEPSAGFFMPEIMGGGAALADLDGDGHLDAYLVQSQGPNRLFKNRGDGTFVDATDGSGADDRGYGMGVATGDFDGDGRVDLFVTNVGPDVLLRNLGGGRFEDASARFAGGAGLPDEWSSSAAFVDFDRDGDLDLFVTTYLDWSRETEIDCYTDAGALDYCSPQSYAAPLPDRLYRNEGGDWVDVSQVLGVSAATGTGLGVLAGDFDGDGWSEIFVANDGMPDHLWVRTADGRFEERAAMAGAAVDFDGTPKAGMGVVAADFDRDGDEDLLVGNMARESDSFFRNESGQFVDATNRVGLGAVSRAFTRFGMAWADFDLDGWLDLYQANGRVALPGTGRGPEDPFAEVNLLLWGRGSDGSAGGFEAARPPGGTSPPLERTSRGLAAGDIDGDGRVDLLIVERDEPASLLRNVVSPRGGWARIDVRTAAGAPALGAEVRFRVGGVERLRTVRTASSYQSADDPRLHVGLGAAERLKDVRVRWVDGTETLHGGVAVGATLRIDGPGSASAAGADGPATSPRS